MVHRSRISLRIVCLAAVFAMLLGIMPPGVTAHAAEDSGEPVGQLKLLARYNDSMQFYDGHVYLLFTSYRDGVDITVDDLYAGYEINDRYYEDIARDISCGSNHNKETTADDYFTENRDMRSVTLDRGQIVTIGMYRGFDLSVAEAALGCVQNSTLMTGSSNAADIAKTAFMENLFSYLKYGTLSSDKAFMQTISELGSSGISPELALDGVVAGGVCFNRELYNQKLEWDQYENVTFAVDITQAQLDRMENALGGNLNKFSILKNSCATVAVKAWNAAVGTTAGGDKTDYYLEPSGSGVFAYIDAPKTVKDEMMKKLPGYWLNNSEGVAEPGAGFTDDTGWVYVSAPKALDGAAAEFGKLGSNSFGAQQPQGEPVGRLTIAARHFLQSQIVAHSLITFTPYEDIDLDVSWYNYYKPTDKYIKLMEDYEDDPGKYPSDPALYSESIDLGDRESFFTIIHNGEQAAPAAIGINAGESITISNYPHDENHLVTLMKSLENGQIASNVYAQIFIAQMHLYDNGEKINGPLAFDTMAATIKLIYQETRDGGKNPADGYSEGGMDINHEAYNLFTKNDAKAPYTFYTVELTRSELESMKAYLADKENNRYAFLVKNCSTGAVDLWNAALYDRPELKLTGNLTGITEESESVCIEIIQLMSKTGRTFNGTGEGGGSNYYPRIAPGYRREPKFTPPEARDLTCTGAPQTLVKPGTASGGTMYYALGSDASSAPDDGWSKTVPKASDEGTYYVWYKVKGDNAHSDSEPACVEVTIRRSAKQRIDEARAVRVTLTRVSSDGYGTLSAKWTSDGEADGYEVLIWNSRRAGGRVTVSKFDAGTDTEMTVTDLMPGSRCYVKARAYRLIDGRKVFGRYSNAGSATGRGADWVFMPVPGHGYGHGYGYSPFVSPRNSYICGRPHLAPNYFRPAIYPYFFYWF